jgi:hypothetical protein
VTLEPLRFETVNPPLEEVGITFEVDRLPDRTQPYVAESRHIRYPDVDAMKVLVEGDQETNQSGIKVDHLLEK